MQRAVRAPDRISSLQARFSTTGSTDHPHPPAIIPIRYQVAIMSLFEQYRMNIPLVVRSLDLLIK